MTATWEELEAAPGLLHWREFVDDVDDVYARAWSIADADGNGEIDLEEFVEFHMAVLTVYEAFQKFDSDDSGTIDAQVG